MDSDGPAIASDWAGRLKQGSVGRLDIDIIDIAIYIEEAQVTKIKTQFQTILIVDN